MAAALLITTGHRSRVNKTGHLDLLTTASRCNGSALQSYVAEQVRRLAETRSAKIRVAPCGSADCRNSRDEEEISCFSPSSLL